MVNHGCYLDRVKNYLEYTQLRVPVGCFLEAAMLSSEHIFTEACRCPFLDWVFETGFLICLECADYSGLIGGPGQPPPQVSDLCR